MDDVLVLLGELVSVDRHGVDVAVKNQLLGVLCSVRVVEVSVCVYSIVSVLQNGVAENVVGLIVPVHPHERHLMTVVLLESVVTNHSPIRALKVVLGGVTTEVVVFCHFDCPPLLGGIVRHGSTSTSSGDGSSELADGSTGATAVGSCGLMLELMSLSAF